MKINSSVCSEVFEILKYMDKTDVMKIPVDILTEIKENKDDNYICKIDKDDLFNRNNVLPETIKYIAWLDVNFWESSSEKERLKKLYIEKKNEEEIVKKEKFNSSKIFDSKEEIKEEKNITEYHESVFSKFINFIKNIFKN